MRASFTQKIEDFNTSIERFGNENTVLGLTNQSTSRKHMIHTNKPAQQPDALRHAGTEISRGQRKPQTAKKRGNGNSEKNGLPPVVVPEAMVREFARVTRYLPAKHQVKARIALVHVVMACPGAERFPEEDIWHQIGTWTSRLRGLKEIEGVTTYHHGQAAAQKILNSMRRAEHDPALTKGLRSHISRFIRSCLQSLNGQMTALLKREPDRALTPDEMMSMVPCTVDLTHMLFRKPKTKSREILPDANESVSKQNSAKPVLDESTGNQDRKPVGEEVSIVKRSLLKIKKLFIS